MLWGLPSVAAAGSFGSEGFEATGAIGIDELTDGQEIRRYSGGTKDIDAGSV